LGKDWERKIPAEVEQKGTLARETHDDPVAATRSLRQREQCVIVVNFVVPLSHVTGEEIERYHAQNTCGGQ
jgi:hypothetical protein